MIRGYSFIATGAATVMFGCVGLFAQAVTGSIAGSVTDPSGAAVAGAAISVTNTATGESRKLQSGAEGEFTAPSLPPGTYRVAAELQGFKRAAASGIQLGVAQRVRVDLVLQMGDVSEAIEVHGEAPLTQADTSELGTTVNESQMRELPLNGRNFVQLTRLIPGVTRGAYGGNSDGGGSLGWRASAAFSANGMHVRQNNFLLDGVDNNELQLQTVVLFPSVEALQEFKVQTSTFSAEFGRALGGVVSLHIKSGTNQLHGSLFEYVRNDKFDANDFFNNKFGRAKPPFRQNQFGGTLGGPIRRDRTFYFVNYQGWRIREPQTFVATVPTALMRQADFSEINRAIYDPLSRAPFSGNRLPASRLDPASSNIMAKIYPEANGPGQRSAIGQVINNYVTNPSLRRQDDQFDIKVDQRLGNSNHFFGRYSFQRSERNAPPSLPFGDGLATNAGDSLVRSQGLALNDVHTFNPRWLNEFRFGLNRFGILFQPVTYGTRLSDEIGIPGVNLDPYSSGLSRITFTPGDITQTGSGQNPLVSYFTTFQWNDNVTYSRGVHTLKFGTSYIRRRKNSLSATSPAGVFDFRPQITSNCGGVASGCTINGNTGFSVATFLLGYPASILRDISGGLRGERRYEFAAYVQNDIRVNRKLTLNAGLRYDLMPGMLEAFNRQSNFDVVGARFVLALADTRYAGGSDYGRRLQKTATRDLGPRFGFAYDATGKGRTILRGGYGIFWNNAFLQQLVRNHPFNIVQNLTTTLAPTFRLSAGIPAPPAFDPNLTPQGAIANLLDPHVDDSYAQSWNFNVQRQLGRDYLVETAYVGTKATHLPVTRNINQAPPIVGVTNIDINRPFIRTYPLLRNMTQMASHGYSTHHSLQAKFTRRFSRSLMFLNSYTWGKTIDMGDAVFDVYNYSTSRGLSDFDIAHTFNSSWTYELPFGPGRRWARSGNRALLKLAGGWNVNGIVLLRSGRPFTVTQQQGLLSTGTGNRPDRIGHGTLPNPTPDRWFDLAAFQPTRDNTGTYGNSGRNILRAPGQAQFDLSLTKLTRFGERFEHQFRCEVFNALNRAQFNNPASTIGAASAGVISSLLFNTPMRQIQFAMKLSF